MSLKLSWILNFPRDESLNCPFIRYRFSQIESWPWQRSCFDQSLPYFVTQSVLRNSTKLNSILLQLVVYVFTFFSFWVDEVRIWSINIWLKFCSTSSIFSSRKGICPIKMLQGAGWCYKFDTSAREFIINRPPLQSCFSKFEMPILLSWSIFT